jgi:hypothetical protein
MGAPSVRAIGCAFAFCLVLLLAACVGMGAVDPQKRERIRTVGFISALPTVFHVQDIGLTVLGNDLKEFPIGSWGVDDYVASKVRAVLGKRYDLRPVTYDRGSIAAASGSWGKLGENIRPHISTQGLDAYLVFRGSDGQYTGTNQYMQGFGIVEHLTINYFLFALYNVVLVDGKDFSVVGSGGAGPRQKVDQSWWPTSFDAAANPRLKAGTLALIDQSLPETITRIGLLD